MRPALFFFFTNISHRKIVIETWSKTTSMRNTTSRWFMVRTLLVRFLLGTQKASQSALEVPEMLLHPSTFSGIFLCWTSNQLPYWILSETSYIWRVCQETTVKICISLNWLACIIHQINKQCLCYILDFIRWSLEFTCRGLALGTENPCCWTKTFSLLAYNLPCFPLDGANLGTNMTCSPFAALKSKIEVINDGIFLLKVLPLFNPIWNSVVSEVEILNHLGIDLYYILSGVWI